MSQPLEKKNTLHFKNQQIMSLGLCSISGKGPKRIKQEEKQQQKKTNKRLEYY